MVTTFLFHIGLDFARGQTNPVIRNAYKKLVIQLWLRLFLSQKLLKHEKCLLACKYLIFTGHQIEFFY